MKFQIYLFLIIPALLCFGMAVFQEFGRRIGLKRLERDPENGLEGAGVIEGGIFAVWGLLLAFTFSGAASHFDLRRSLVGQEANAIGTAYLRLDLLPEAERDSMRKLFRGYLQSRLEIYQNVENSVALEAAIKKSADLQNQIWREAVLVSQTGRQEMPARLLLPAINEMIDITSTRNVATKMHPPWIVYTLLFVLSLYCAMLVGFNQANGRYRHTLHLSGFILITTFIVYVIVDMEFPRLGFIRVDDIDQVLFQLLETMK